MIHPRIFRISPLRIFRIAVVCVFFTLHRLHTTFDVSLVDEEPSVMSLLAVPVSDKSQKGGRVLVIDIVSIGSQSRPQYQDAQELTFGSHVTVRNFFRITEADDLETSCHSNLTLDDVVGITRFCRRRSRQIVKKHFHLSSMRRNYATGRWLEKKKNPVGWMCAQKRPADGFRRVLKMYENTTTIPDYLFVMDDDTYVNMANVTNFLPGNYPADQALAVAGCMIRSDLVKHNFTIPFGGFGMIFTRPAIENFLRPIHCQNRSENNDDEFLRLACWRLSQNPIGELPLFKEGMNVVDLMQAYVSNQPYQNYKEWNEVGFCLHSDWLWGYFVNFYHIAVRTVDPTFRHLLEERLRGYMDSLIYAGGQTSAVRPERKECDNKADKCTADSHLCHYVTPDQMRNLHDVARQQTPYQFRSTQ